MIVNALNITHSTVEVKQKHLDTLLSVLIQKLYSNKILFFWIVIHISLQK